MMAGHIGRIGTQDVSRRRGMNGAFLPKSPQTTADALMKNDARTREIVRFMARSEPTDDQGRAPPGWVSNAELLQRLRCSRATLQRWRSSGQLPFAKVGQKVFYHLEDVGRFLSEHRKA